MTKFGLGFFFLILFLNKFGFGKSIFVSPVGYDTQPGSLDQPVKTINYAIQLAQPGDVIRARAGFYREEVKFVRDGEPNAPITLMNYANETAIISGAEPVTQWQRYFDHIYVSPLNFPTLQVWQDTMIFLKPVARLNQMMAGSFHYDAENRRLFVWCQDNALPEQHLIEAARRRNGINLSRNEQGTGCSYIELRANTTGRLIVQHVMGTEYEAFGIYLGFGSHDNVISGASRENRNFIIRCIGRWWCDDLNWYMGIQLRSNMRPEGSQHCLIQYADISWCGDKGIQLWGENTSFNTIRYNNVHDNGVHGIVPNGGAHENLIEWNRVWGHDGAENRMNEGGAGIKTDDAHGNVIQYNLCWHNSFGIGIIDDCENTQVYHNICYQNRGYAQQLGYGLMSKGTDPQKSDICNNVFMDNSIAQLYFDQNAVGNQNHRIEANLIYTSEANPTWGLIRWGNHGYLDFADWKSISGYGDKCLNQAPGFIAPQALNFYLLPESPLINSGMKVGLPFVEEAPDIGVFERQKVTLDARIITEPDTISRHETVEIFVEFTQPVLTQPVIHFRNDKGRIFTQVLTGQLPGIRFEGQCDIDEHYADGTYEFALDEAILLLENFQHGFPNCEHHIVDVNIPPLVPNAVMLQP